MARFVRGEKASLVVVTIAVGVAMITGGALSLSAYKRFRQSSVQRSSAFRLQEQRERIVRLDTVLATSARLLVATGEQRWRDRYDRFSPILDRTLEVAAADTQGTPEAVHVEHIREARAQLSETERRAFELARNGRAAEATAALMDPDYEEARERVARQAARMVPSDRSFLRLLELAGTLERRTEDVTTDVRLAVTTGERRWVARYREAAAELAVAQRSAAAALSRTRNSGLLRQLASLRSDLQRVERRAIEAVESGNTQAAREILERASYDERSEDYQKRIGRLSERLRAAAEAERRSERIEALANIGAICCVLAALLIAWLYALRTLERFAAERERAELALDQARAEAERRLSAATAELQAEVDRLRQVDDLKTTFLSHVAHELRTPLTAIVSAAKILIRHHEKKPEVVPRFGSTIVVEGERLTRLINDVLDLVKIEAGKLQWQKERVDPWGLVQQAAALVEPLAHEKKRELRVEFPSLVPPVWGDRDRLVQVLTNLLNNAVKFTNEGDSIVVSAEQDGGMCRFTVRDTGVGIPEEDLPKVFEKFHQVAGQPTDQPKSASTGLGLTICREIVEHHGGRIWVESTLGEGTAFHFTVPFEDGVCDDDAPASIEAVSAAT
ncbi:MAG: hypothetical protein D6760_09095 [Deltaproteobacteria bacterium]|nr:MAG: hypothetical protein D6760_09095 [Deltaproteobacteria bacterium]